MNPARRLKRIDGRGRCDQCGFPPHLHGGRRGVDTSDVYGGPHRYECAVDEDIRAMRKARFIGSVDWLPGHTRRWVPEAGMYEITRNEAPMDMCGWPGCFLGPHPRAARSTVQPGTHDYRRPTDAQLLARMRARRAARMRHRVEDRTSWTTFGDVWHAWAEDDEADVFAVNRLYATRRAAEVTTRLRLGISRFAPLVRDPDRPDRWTLRSERHEVTAVIMRRPVWRRAVES